MGLSREQARDRAWSLHRELKQITERDPEQDVMGIAVPVLDGVITACREHVADDPAVKAVVDLISPEAIDDGSVRAVDLMLVVHEVAMALGKRGRGTSLR